MLKFEKSRPGFRKTLWGDRTDWLPFGLWIKVPKSLPRPTALIKKPLYVHYSTVQPPCSSEKIYWEQKFSIVPVITQQLQQGPSLEKSCLFSPLFCSSYSSLPITLFPIVLPTSSCKRKNKIFSIYTGRWTDRWMSAPLSLHADSEIKSKGKQSVPSKEKQEKKTALLPISPVFKKYFVLFIYSWSAELYS